MVSANLFVPLFLRSTLCVAHAAQQGVLAEALSDGQLCLLHAAFLFASRLLLFGLQLLGFIIREKVQLLRCVVMFHLVFKNDMIHGQVQPSYQQVGVNDAVEEPLACLDDEG